LNQNKNDCDNNEKQIQYTTRIIAIRPLEPGEAERYWPGNEGRWKYIVICEDTKPIYQPFNLEEILGENSIRYKPIMTFKKFDPQDEERVKTYLREIGHIND